MVHEYLPKGVCSMKITVEVEENIIKNVKFLGGCAGNTKGVAALIEGMNIDDAIKRIKGIECGGKGTSCPDQLAIALEEIKEKVG